MGQESKKIQAEYMPIESAIRILGNYKPNELISEKVIQKILSMKQFETKVLDKKLLFREFNKKTHYVMKKNSFSEFIKNYINISDALILAGIIRVSLVQGLKRWGGIERVRILRRDRLIFYNRAQFNDYLTAQSDNRIHSKHIDGYYSKSECLQIFNINIGMFKWLDIEQFRVINNKAVYYPCQIIEEYIKKAKNELEQIRKSYYLLSEINQLKLQLISHNIRRNEIIEFIPVPKHLKPFLGNYDANFLYNKESIIRYNKKKKMNETLAIEFTKPYDTYKHQLETLKITFPCHLKWTEELWNTYVKDFLQTRKQNIRTLRSTLSTLVNCTKCLLRCNKEIYDFGSKELNILFFNSDIQDVIKNRLFYFLKEVFEHFKLKYNKNIYNLNEMNNPTKINSKRRDKTIYDLKAYMTCLKYANNIHLHKQNALADFKNIITRKVKYKRYDSAWLYVLVHLNNAWRHSDVIDFPRISFEGTEIKDWEWLKTNDISRDDAARILYQIKHKVLLHHKTGAERFFFWSEELLIALATAAAISEFRIRMDDPASDHLIDFKTKGQLFKGPPYSSFFRNFDSDIKFESRKMNRTLLSLVFSIISRGKSDPDALELAKHMRGHKDIDTTNIYILIPQEHMDFLTSQLFDRDSFGYIPDILSELLFGPTKSIGERTQQIQTLKTSFGSIYKIENFAVFLNEVLKENGEVEEIIRQSSKEEILDKQFKLMTHQLPSKEENFQCLGSEQGCLYPEADCQNCHLSIPNFYALSSITQRIKEQLLYFKNNFSNLKFESEKIRNAKLFTNDMLLIMKAIDKFGGDVVFRFMDITKEEFKTVLSTIPSVNKYLI